MAKWVLDVLGETHVSDSSVDLRPSLYRDDRQVKLLHVTLHQNWPGQDGSRSAAVPATWIFAQPLRDVLEDIRVMGELRSRNDPELPDLAELDENDYPDIGGAEAWDVDVPSPGVDPVQNRINDFLVRWGSFHNAERAQKVALTSMDLQLDLALELGWRRIANTRLAQSAAGHRRRKLDEMRDRYAAEHWEHVLSFPFNIRLPPLPATQAERDSFRTAIRSSLDCFHRRWPAWKTLLVPLKVTLIVVPPLQGKDLDNVALDVLPAVHDIFRPHIEPWQLSPLYPEGDEAAADRQRAMKRLKSLNSESVTAYQVIELQRMPSDPPAGFLQLMLGLGSGYDHVAQSLWIRNDSKLLRLP
ncbi:hypothetical protein D2L64_08395 [Micromonospora radicis]|uniref:Uncharacterized protein n=2 Tax=Micromonospora radicis TaxID=1894971 RepID=A0A418MWZ3_9ACTN|nr:hypothetical protein D2L64_08395 [Micromonospora radicis]